MSQAANLFDGIPAELPEELFTALLTTPSVRIERIVSLGQASPAGFWYQQPTHEWVLLVEGAARLVFEGEPAIELMRGGFVDIPAGQRHRVEWTDPLQRTVWLAIHYP